jgi:hypothetical protein
VQPCTHRPFSARIAAVRVSLASALAGRTGVRQQPWAPRVRNGARRHPCAHGASWHPFAAHGGSRAPMASAARRPRPAPGPARPMGSPREASEAADGPIGAPARVSPPPCARNAPAHTPRGRICAVACGDTSAAACSSPPPALAATAPAECPEAGAAGRRTSRNGRGGTRAHEGPPLVCLAFSSLFLSSSHPPPSSPSPSLTLSLYPSVSLNHSAFFFLSYPACALREKLSLSLSLLSVPLSFNPVVRLRFDHEPNRLV